MTCLKKFKYKKISENHFKIYFYINKYIINEIGNLFRRILLSKLNGYKIRYFKIKGLSHQYCYINGILEDALEITLNLKKIFFKLSIDTLYLKIIKKGPCYFKSEDFFIKNICKVLNNIKICKINKNSIFIFYFKIIKGKGYLNIKSSSNNKIYINDFFSPIINVYYKNIKKKILINIKTNGTISPLKAFLYTSKYIIKNFNYIHEAS
ncbi:hypothetical protein [Candidatus Vidania fulgoroideorum]